MTTPRLTEFDPAAFTIFLELLETNLPQEKKERAFKHCIPFILPNFELALSLANQITSDEVKAAALAIILEGALKAEDGDAIAIEVAKTPCKDKLFLMAPFRQCIQEKRFELAEQLINYVDPEKQQILRKALEQKKVESK